MKSLKCGGKSARETSKCPSTHDDLPDSEFVMWIAAGYLVPVGIEFVAPVLPI